MLRLYIHSNKDDLKMFLVSYLCLKSGSVKKLQIIYVIVAAMDKDIAVTAATDVHLVPDEIANDNADEHAVQEAQDASMYCCLEEC